MAPKVGTAVCGTARTVVWDCLLYTSDESSVIVASHRGDWRNFPENSLEAIDNAIKMGVDIVEIALQRTKDGVLILMHDPKIDLTTTGKGTISEVTYYSIAKTHLKNGCNIRTCLLYTSLY